MTQDTDKLVVGEEQREIEQLEERLTRLKELDIKNAVVSLWVVHRGLSRGKARYSAFKVDTDLKLRAKLAGAVNSVVSRSNTVQPYEYITADLDETLLEQPIKTTDFDEIIGLVNRNGEDFKVDGINQIVGAWGYVIKLQAGDVFVYGFRQIGGNWASKNIGDNWMFKDRVLMDLDDQPIFRADRKVDFIAYEDSVFILDKKNFEKAVNFREGMTRHRDEILKEFEEMDLVSDVDVIKSVVGDNLHNLRKLASVKNNGYYRLPWYMGKLKQINDSEDWGLSINDGGQIQSEEGNVDLILTLLNNNRLRSPITEDFFDVAVKHPVSEPA